jgi:hypothetical protein
MQNRSEILNIPLHDIKPLIEIQEYSFEYLIAIGIFVSLLLVGVGYLLYRYFKNKNKFNIRAEHSKLLHSISLKDTKEAAYKITLYGLTFKDDSLRHKQNYEALVDLLENYKYKKNVEKFDEDVKRQFERYLGMIDV